MLYTSIFLLLLLDVYLRMKKQPKTAFLSATVEDGKVLATFPDNSTVCIEGNFAFSMDSQKPKGFLELLEKGSDLVQDLLG